MTTRAIAVRTNRSPTRCPYCHDHVSLEAPWVACRGCLARHHADCWGDARACATCGASDCLHDDAAGSAAARTRPDATRELLERLGEEPKSSAARGLDYVGSLLTAGLLPAIGAELRLVRHAETNRVLEDSKPKLGFAPDSLDRTIAQAKRRARIGAVSFGVSLLVALVGGACLGSRATESAGIMLVTSALVIWIPTLLALLARHHRAVRRHDASQLALTVRRYGLDADTTYRLIARHEDAWQRTSGSLARATLLAALVSGLCFPLAWLTLPLWLARAFQVPLEEHSRRELLGAFRW